MPRADGSIIIDTKLDTADLEKNLDGLGSRLRLAGGLAAGALAGGVQAAAGAIGAYTIAQIGAAEADRAGVRAQQAVLKSMNLFGDSVGTVSQRLQDYASKNAILLGIDDEVIRNTQTKLLTFRELAKTADEMGGAFDRATMLAQDLAAAGFGAAESNAVQLGKALQDPVKGITALTRSGINFTASQKEQIQGLVEQNRLWEAQNIILTEIESQVGGTAAASVLATDRIKVAIDEMGESFGAAFLPIIDSVMPAISNFITGLTPLMETLGSAIAGFLEGAATQEQVQVAAANLGKYLGDSLIAAEPFISAALNALLTTVAGMVPGMAEAIGLMASNIVGTLAESIPVYIQAVIDAMLALLTALADNSDAWVQPMVDAALDVVTILVTELIKPSNVQRMVDAGVTLGGALVNGLLRGLGEWWIELLGGEIPDLPAPIGNGAGIPSPGGAPILPTSTVPSKTTPVMPGAIKSSPSNVTINNNFNQPVRTFSEMTEASRRIGQALL